MMCQISIIYVNFVAIQVQFQKLYGGGTNKHNGLDNLVDVCIQKISFTS